MLAHLVKVLAGEHLHPHHQRRVLGLVRRGIRRGARCNRQTLAGRQCGQVPLAQLTDDGALARLRVQRLQVHEQRREALAQVAAQDGVQVGAEGRAGRREEVERDAAVGAAPSVGSAHGVVHLRELVDLFLGQVHHHTGGSARLEVQVLRRVQQAAVQPAVVGVVLGVALQEGLEQLASLCTTAEAKQELRTAL